MDNEDSEKYEVIQWKILRHAMTHLGEHELSPSFTKIYRGWKFKVHKYTQTIRKYKENTALWLKNLKTKNDNNAKETYLKRLVEAFST